MNFFKRAIKNITRLKTKSVLLILTFFLIGNLVIIGLGISYASENAKTLTRLKMKPVVTYEIDYDAFQDYIDTLETDDEINEAYNNYPQLNKADFDKLAASEYVATADALVEYQAYADNFTAVVSDTAQDNSSDVYYSDSSADYTYTEPDVYLLGNAYDDMVEIQDGTFVIDEGRFYTQDEIDSGAKVAVIEQELASSNNLQVGDYINIKLIQDNSYQSQYIGDLDTSIEYQIIGIYTNNTTLDDSDSWMSDYSAYLPQNKILVPSTSLTEKLYEINLAAWNYYKEMYPDEDYYQNDDNIPSEDTLYSTFVLLLNDPLDVESFVEENSANLPQFTMLNANDDLFQTFAKPLDTMSLFANIIVWIVVINAVVIISLVTALTMKTREHEIGILLAIGVSKLKVVAQLFMELAIVAIIGFSLAVVSGSLASRSIGQAVLDYQMTNTDTETDDNNYYYYSDDYFTEITQDDMLSEYEVTISPLIIAEIYLVGVGVVLVSILIPSMMIMRFNPKRILTNTY